MTAIERNAGPAVPDVGKMETSVAMTLRSLTLAPEDEAVAALATRYAHTMDEARTVANALSRVKVGPDDEDAKKVLDALKARVTAQAVVSDLGPKLLAALASIGATPQARAAITKGTPTSGQSNAGDALARLRAERAGKAG